MRALCAYKTWDAVADIPRYIGTGITATGTQIVLVPHSRSVSLSYRPGVQAVGCLLVLGLPVFASLACFII